MEVMPEEDDITPDATFVKQRTFTAKALEGSKEGLANLL
jgi:hypothetical protein